MQPASYQVHSSLAYTQIAQVLILKKPARRERVAKTERIARRGRFTVPIADLSAPACLCLPTIYPGEFFKPHYRPSSPRTFSYTDRYPSHAKRDAKVVNY